ncbi:hypothetical protein [Paracidovorax oryzae]|uniref:hypothetical protein n=1 Tax=Paracidovorax oryzae TaxID=862720 RepID=UPI000A01DAD0|nr:hypothetical protein [Paracidovorax oryzae]
MTGTQLFAQLVQRFQNYTDAAVLWVLLKEEADVREHSTTAGSMAHEQLCGTARPTTVQRSFQRLELMRFISVRTHKNTKTLITVDREAVLEFLRQPLAERLPALSDKQFSFLEAWNGEAVSPNSQNEAIPTVASDNALISHSAPSSSEPITH